ncbi:succinate--CoA ligase subunit alpha [Natranaerobius thermophilus]|uniref:Succinate--CoA ligase [ADP-forming] subunit alpha n=1 Tax=Natranaerobius thermophilus (strain ATCC BAA-1301 / DSM 18059 / JW/NM-WN-LF) TaxID=457570 RepID=B2A0T0_NATTJ|nr:succinate--CoA ligase subunit alpha [Natranaerobius thermophilus]ACB85960.1 succinyl-CoA synthetase (ADP-forming) alpha subunit [Natranaerobius thermophilus JW/NM-WN-LF]
MAILLDKNSKILVQGITGYQGRFHTRQMLEYGSNVVAGVSPGKGGQEVEGVPVYNSAASAVRETDANVSAVMVPASFGKDAVFEAIDAGMDLVAIITEHIPVQDAMEIMAFARERGTTIIGPNTFGIITPGQSKLGIMPNESYQPGRTGLVARSGTLSYQIAEGLSRVGVGQSTAIGLGGDRVVGSEFIDMLEHFEQDPGTDQVVMVGEIGGTAEEEAAEFIANKMTKPVYAYIAGKSAPPGKRMGHAGAIIERGKGTFDSKVQALRSAGVEVASLPWELVEILKKSGVQ